MSPLRNACTEAVLSLMILITTVLIGFLVAIAGPDVYLGLRTKVIESPKVNLETIKPPLLISRSGFVVESTLVTS